MKYVGIVRIWLYSISFDPNQQRRKYFWYFWSNLNSDVSGLVTPSLHKTFPHQPELEIGIVRKSQSSKLVLFVKLSNHSFRGSHRCPLGKESPLGKLGHFPQIALSFVTIISFISFQLASLGSERIGTRTQSVLWQKCKICCLYIMLQIITICANYLKNLIINHNHLHHCRSAIIIFSTSLNKFQTQGSSNF